MSSSEALGLIPARWSPPVGDELIFGFLASGRRPKPSFPSGLEWHPFGTLDELLDDVLAEPHTRWLVYQLKMRVLERRMTMLEAATHPDATIGLAPLANRLDKCRRLAWPWEGERVVQFTSGEVVTGEAARALYDVNEAHGEVRPRQVEG